MGIFSKFFNALKKTKDSLAAKISSIFVGELDDDFYEELEYILISSDMGAEASSEIIAEVKSYAKKHKIKSAEEFKKVLRQVMIDSLSSMEQEDEFPMAITFIGVNGVGKTTSIGKLAHYYKSQGKSVLMIAGDTFRAAASDQLTEWSKRAGVRIVKYTEGADPGAVVFDGLSSAISKNDDVVLIDTAGRLHNKSNLMDELKKISNVEHKVWKDRTTKNYIVLDATTGQNALSQVKAFDESVGIDGIVLTKLDGTAKGGIVFAIAKEYHIPVVFVGTGEGLDDMVPFDAKEFVENII